MSNVSLPPPHFLLSVNFVRLLVSASSIGARNLFFKVLNLAAAYTVSRSFIIVARKQDFIENTLAQGEFWIASELQKCEVVTTNSKIKIKIKIRFRKLEKDCWFAWVFVVRDCFHSSWSLWCFWWIFLLVFHFPAFSFSFPSCLRFYGKWTFLLIRDGNFPHTWSKWLDLSSRRSILQSISKLRLNRRTDKLFCSRKGIAISH